MSGRVRPGPNLGHLEDMPEVGLSGAFGPTLDTALQDEIGLLLVCRPMSGHGVLAGWDFCQVQRDRIPTVEWRVDFFDGTDG